MSRADLDDLYMDTGFDQGGDVCMAQIM